MNRRLGSLVAGLAACLPPLLQAQSALPSGMDAQTKTALEQIIDSARASGLPIEPLIAKAAEGRLKQASDAQIVAAVRSLSARFRAIRSELGTTLDTPAMTAAATAMAVGIPISSIRVMRDAAASSPAAHADLAGALVTATDLVAQRVSPASAAIAVQSLLARRASPEQFARLRAGTSETIAAGRAPDQAVRSATETIVKGLPASLPTASGVRPPPSGDGFVDPRVPSAPSTTRNPR